MKEEEFYIAESEVTLSMKVVRFYFHKLGGISPGFTKYLFWKLFTKPRQRPLSSFHKAFLNTGKKEMLLSNRFKKKYVLNHFGEGDKIVMIFHGWEGRTSDFQGVIKGVLEKTEYKVISVDFPGHGASPKSEAHLPIFIDVIKSAVENYPTTDVLLGHSLGAASLAMAVGQNSTLFSKKRIVFLGLHPVPSEFFEQYKAVTRIKDSLYEKCVKYAEKKVGNKLTDYSCYRYLDSLNDNEVHFIHDQGDLIIHLKRVEKLHEVLMSSRLYTGNHGGHFRHYKHPDVIEEVVAICNS